MIIESSWRGRVAGRREAGDVVTLRAFISQAPGAGGSMPLLALGDDGGRYWVKLAANPQGPMVLVNEQIVARCGELIGAPTCRVRVVDVPDALAGMVSGVRVDAGLAHGSVNVDDTVNRLFLDHRAHDDNPRRHAGLFALHDWCWGRDSQWLFALSDEHKTYSHDHGHFFPGGPDWPAHAESLRDSVDTPHRLQDEVAQSDPGGLDRAAVMEVADALDAVTTDDLANILSGIPSEWPVADGDLELMGFFLERRAPQVAERLRAMTGEGAAQ